METLRGSTERHFREYQNMYRRNLHPIVGREHFRVNDITEHRTYYFGSMKDAYDMFYRTIRYGNNAEVYYKEY